MDSGSIALGLLGEEFPGVGRLPSTGPAESHEALHFEAQSIGGGAQSSIIPTGARFVMTYDAL